MKNQLAKLAILAVSSGVLLSACNSGTSTTTDSGGTTIAGYTMSFVGGGTELFNSSCTTVGSSLMQCNVNTFPGLGTASVSFVYQGTPGFYIEVQPSTVNVSPTESATPYTYIDPFSGETTTIPGNCNSTTPQNSYSCTFTLNAAGITESQTLNFMINGQAGESTIYTVQFNI